MYPALRHRAQAEETSVSRVVLVALTSPPKQSSLIPRFQKGMTTDLYQRAGAVGLANNRLSRYNERGDDGKAQRD
jgi:hypothetical protein